MSKKQDLIDKIDVSNHRLADARTRVRLIKQTLTEAETEQIEAKIEQENLAEELQQMTSTEVSKEKTEEQKDVERFKGILPSIFEMIEKIDSKDKKEN
jgi:regulator of replication initiation timing